MMLLPSDNTYQQTIKILQGKASMHSDFQPLAAWIQETYGVKPVNFIYEIIENNTTPRLEVCFEFESDKVKFLDNNQFAPDKEKQLAIAGQFTKMVEAHKVLVPAGSSQGADSDHGQPEEGLWVIFSSFDRVAKFDANMSIPQSEIDALQKEIGNNDLWCITRLYDCATFFLFTDAQLETYSNSGVKEIWAKKYFNLLKKYDPFDYFKEAEFFIYLDSKENFDNNYESNWYYYFK